VKPLRWSSKKSMKNSLRRTVWNLCQTEPILLVPLISGLSFCILLMYEWTSSE
jgi:hypothetical protein